MQKIDILRYVLHWYENNPLCYSLSPREFKFRPFISIERHHIHEKIRFSPFALFMESPLRYNQKQSSEIFNNSINLDALLWVNCHGHAYDFWWELQILHDQPNYWNFLSDEQLNDNGREYVNKFKNDWCSD